MPDKSRRTGCEGPQLEAGIHPSAVVIGDMILKESS